MSPPSDGPRENGPAEFPRSCPLRASPAPLSRIDERAVARIIERGPALNSGHARKGRGCRPIHGRRREAVFAAFADAPENPGACLPGPSGRGSSAGRSSGARRSGVKAESHRRASSGGTRDGIRSFMSNDCHIADRPGFRFGTARRALRSHEPECRRAAARSSQIRDNWGNFKFYLSYLFT